MNPKARPVPGLTKPTRTKLPTLAERTLNNGLRVVTVRRGGVPMVQLRLRVPFAGRRADHLPKRLVLESTMTHGTSTHTRGELAVALQGVGGALSVSTDTDRLLVRGESLRSGLPRVLQLLAELVTDAQYPKDAVAGEVSRLQIQLQQRLSQPGEIAAEALRRRLYAGHPYGRDLPEPEEIAAVTAGAVRKMHRRWVVPPGSLLVVVGDITPTRALDQVESALAQWSGEATKPAPAPDVPTGGDLTLVDRPGAVQSNLRLGGPGLTRRDDDYAALAVANVAFGGYFASRLTQNIREDKGYTYSPRSGLVHAATASGFVLEVDVATEVTGPSLVEISYELGRIATGPLTSSELESAVHYLTGLLALQTATQAGLAGVLETLLADGLDVSWLREHPAALARATVDDVLEQARRFLAPAGLATIVVGDASRVGADVAALTPVVMCDAP
jgi:Predicted Zn-dependent peptidases